MFQMSQIPVCPIASILAPVDTPVSFFSTAGATGNTDTDIITYTSNTQTL